MKIPQILKTKQDTIGICIGQSYVIGTGQHVLQLTPLFPNGYISVLYEGIIIDVLFSKLEGL